MIKKLYGLLAILLLWFVLYLVLKTPAIPNPFPTIIYTFNNFNTFISHIMWSMFRITVAIVSAGVVGVGIGLLMGTSKRVNDLVSPLVHILYPIPKIAFLPVLMLLFGLGETPKILLIFSVIVFQFILSTADAIQEINASYYDSVLSLGLNQYEIYKHCIIPAILPSIFTSLRISFGVSVAILFFAETFSTKFGIGYFIMNSFAMVNYQSMYAGIIILSILGLLVYSMIDYIEKKVCPWIF